MAEGDRRSGARMQIILRTHKEIAGVLAGMSENNPYCFSLCALWELCQQVNHGRQHYGERESCYKTMSYWLNGYEADGSKSKQRKEYDKETRARKKKERAEKKDAETKADAD